MRSYDAEDTYNFLVDYYNNMDSMRNSFYVLKRRDKTGIYKNKSYLIPNESGYYYEKDIQELLGFKREKYNTITYAQQLIVDFEAIFDYLNIPVKSKFAKIIKLNGQQMHELTFSYEKAVEIIETLKNRLLAISPEARKEIKFLFNKVKE